MKKVILLCGALLALTASVAGAAGLNLYWSGCGASSTNHLTNVNNPCTATSGSLGTMVASYVAPAGVTALSGFEAVVDLQSASTALPAWWDFFNLGACRVNSLGNNTTLPGDPGNCLDAWDGATASGGLAAYNRSIAPNRARMIIAWAVLPQAVLPLTAGNEYFACNLTVNRNNAAGCAGCSEPVCIVLNSIKLTQPVGTLGGDVVVDSPATSQFVSYQGGVVAGGCPGATPTLNRTWGAVKSLYRN